MSQFLGKTISIVSNSNVRYVGVLHEINTNESTLSLKGARSFGAEGGGHEPYLAESVFDCIVFKSSDVKNLSLLDSVPSEHISNFSFATQQNPSSSYNPQQDHASFMPCPPLGFLDGFQTFGIPFPNSPVTGFFNQNPLGMPSSLYKFAQPATLDRQVPMAQTMESGFNYPTPYCSSYPFNISELATQEHHVLPLPDPTFQTSVPSFESRTQRVQPPDTFVDTQLADSETKKPTPVSISADSIHNGHLVQNGSTHFPAKSFDSPSPKGSHNGAFPRPVDGDFDFVEMNAKFSKVEALKEDTTSRAIRLPPAPESLVIPEKLPQAFYDKKSSFFDNISFNTRERAENFDVQAHREDEHRRNVETFGSDLVYKNYRGGYRANFQSGHRSVSTNESSGYRGESFKRGRCSSYGANAGYSRNG